MRLLTLVVLAPPKLDDANLVALAVAFDRGNHLGTADVGRADGHRGPRADEQHLIEFDAGALHPHRASRYARRHLLGRGTVYRPWLSRHTWLKPSLGSPYGPQKSRELYGGWKLVR